MSHPSFFSGLSGLQLNIPKYKFPEPFQQASRMTYYSSLFNSIEINSTFYRIPLRKTIAQWAISVGSHFKFTFKLWKEVTHSRLLTFDPEPVAQFLRSVDAVQDKSGCLLIQLPRSSGAEHFKRMEQLLHFIRSSSSLDWKIAIEFRNPSWYTDPTDEMLKRYQAAWVMHDFAKSATPFRDQVSDFVYVRFHGPAGNYRDSYTEDFLSEYAGYIRLWLSEGKTVFVYFNNTMGDAFNNLITINRLLSGSFNEEKKEPVNREFNN